ncbi:MAG: hypothetical protein FWE91_08145 [Defluviitaleaceae bacterium]|nr:hypothetical protein [Defluviitaleaceae bacterium]MCL2836376.1 hypothetical protein [Defluviitaleaceae bacterium]
MRNKRPEISIIILLSIFVVSLSLFIYQVTLTRLYSAVLSYHYVFLTTSFAILGLGIGSVWAYRDRARLDRILGETVKQPKDMMKQINKWLLVLSCGFIIVYLLIYFQPFVNTLAVYIILGIIPFVIGGYFYSILFKAWPEFSRKLYFSDLAGAGTGSIIIVVLLDNTGMFKTAAAVCLLPLLITLSLPAANNKLKITEYAIPVLLAVCLFLPARAASAVEVNFYGLLNSAGKQFGVMQSAGLSPEIVFSKWDSFARTDLIKLGNHPDRMIITIDGGANAPMFQFDGNADSLGKFKEDNGFIPFAVGGNDNVLLIGIGGGLDVLYALAGESKNIAAVEINEASIDAVRLFGDFNGHILDLPEVRTYVQDGRNFVRNTTERFDLIFMSLVVTNTTQGVGFALSENYIYTTEAMGEYLDRLSENGRIAFVAHDMITINKLVTTAMKALVNRGVPFEETPDYIALFYSLTQIDNAVQIFEPVIIIKDTPFTGDEASILETEILARKALPAYLPYVHEHGIISQVKDGSVTSLRHFIDSFNMNVKPATDDNPYFYNFDRGINTGLLQILAFGVLASLLLFTPYAVKKRNRGPSIYFGLLGMGFMMIQIPLIQRFILYLGHPTPAFSYILAAMLAGCGIGGFLNNSKAFNKSFHKIYMPPILAAIINIIFLLSLSTIFQQTAGFSIAGKIVTASIAAAATGFFMGMPFPRGLSLLGVNNRKDLIPVMLGINGTLSVVGSVTSIILSMAFGFTAALTAGAVVYIIVGLCDGIFYPK